MLLFHFHFFFNLYTHTLTYFQVGIPSSLINLIIQQCEKVEEIIGHVGEEVKENRIAFNELKLLKLYDLPMLKSFCLESYTLEFPSLEEVSITHCLNMKTFSQGILSTPKLHEVRVNKKRENELCHWEGNLIPPYRSFTKKWYVLIDFTQIAHASPLHLHICLVYIYF